VAEMQLFGFFRTPEPAGVPFLEGLFARSKKSGQKTKKFAH
jgi:hypothetical protein